MWSLTLQRVRRTGGPENFQSSVKKDFFNSIGTKRTLILRSFMSVGGSRADIAITRAESEIDPTERFRARHNLPRGSRFPSTVVALAIGASLQLLYSEMVPSGPFV